MKENKGFSIIIAIVVLVVFAALGVIGLSLLSTESRISASTALSSQAFFIAEGGLQYYIEQLQNQASSWRTPPAKPVDKLLGNGTFTITTTNEEDDKIDVISEAHVAGADGEIVVRVARAAVPRSALSGYEEAPEAFNYAMHSSGNCTFYNSNNGTINGNVSAAGQIEGEERMTINGTVTEGSTVPNPGPVDMAGYKSIAHHIRSGRFEFQAYTIYGSPGSEEIWYIEGDAYIPPHVTIYGTIIAEGRIRMDYGHHITIDSASGCPALVSGSSIHGYTLRDSTINGLIYADSCISLGTMRNTIINGTLLAGLIQLNSSLNITINYDSDILNNPPPYFISAGGEPIIWRESWKGGY